MTPEQIKEKLDEYFGMVSHIYTQGRRRVLIYTSPMGVELFRIELLGSITHSLSGQLEHLNSVVGG